MTENMKEFADRSFQDREEARHAEQRGGEDDVTVIVVEEIGDPGLDALDNPDFVMVASVTDNPGFR